MRYTLTIPSKQQTAAAEKKGSIIMKLSINQATALECKGFSLERDLELCEKYGYDYIEPRTMDGMVQYLEKHSIEELAEYFKSHKVKPLAFNTLCFFNNRSSDEFQGVLKELKEMCEWGKAIGCKTVITVPTVDKKLHKDEIHQSAVACLKEMGKIAKSYGMRISVEFLGAPTASINTFADAWKIIEEVNMDNVGITIDCFHFHGMGSQLSDLAKADGKKIFVVHLNDTEDYPIGLLTDADRLWPGDGCIDLQGIFKTLKEIGWQEDVVSLELFRPEYWDMDADAVYRIGKEKSEALLQKVL